MKNSNPSRSELRRILLDETSSAEFEAFTLQILEDARLDAENEAEAREGAEDLGAFAEALADEDDLIDEYVRGELEDDKARRVEALLLSGLEGRRRLDFARALADHVARRTGSSTVAAPVLAAAGLDPGTVTAEDATRGPWWRRLLASLQAPAARPAWVLCAALLLAMLLQATWWMQRTSAPSEVQATAPNTAVAEREKLRTEASRLRTRVAEQNQQIESLRADVTRLAADADAKAEVEDSRPTPSEVATLLLAAATRGSGGASEVPTLRLPPGAKEAEFEIDLTGVADADVVRARLLDPGGFPVWGRPRAEVERQDGFQALRLRVPASVLAPGVHRLLLESDAPGEAPREVAEFEVRVAAPR